MMSTVAPLIQTRQMRPHLESHNYVVNDLDIQIKAGELVCVVGPDHSGKTGYLRALAGIDCPAQGAVLIFEHDTAAYTRKNWLEVRKDVCFVGHDTALISSLDGLQNVVLPALYHQCGSAVDLYRKARAMLEDIGVHEYEGIYPALISKLRRQKLMLVRALLLEPRILVLDNPFATLDILAVSTLNDFIIDRMRQSGFALVMATDELEFVKRHDVKILFVARGKTSVFSGWMEFVQCKYPEVRRFYSMVGKDADTDVNN